jgi:isopenicillin-N epimerase
MNQSSKSASAPDWAAVCNSIERDPSIVYLNTGTAGLLTKAVHLATIEYRTRLHHNPTDYAWRAMSDELWLARSKLASYLQTTPDRIVFFGNISQAVNTFCLSCKFPKGSEILLSDHEYGALRWAWERASHKNDWHLKTVRLPIQPTCPEEVTEAIDRAITPATKLVFLSHVLYTTGMVLPIADICQRVRSRGVMSFIDGAHAPGMLPLSLDSLGADYYAANLHKWFLCPVGAAFLYARHGGELHLEPWQVSWGYRDDRTHAHQRNEFGSTPWIRQFEVEGTRDLTPWYMVPHNVDFFETLGAEKVQQRHHELSDHVRARLTGCCDLQLSTPSHPALRGGLTAFRMPPSIDAQAFRSRLWNEFRIEINMVPHADQHFLRVSTHVYNTVAEIEWLAHAITKLSN